MNGHFHEIKLHLLAIFIQLIHSFLSFAPVARLGALKMKFIRFTHYLILYLLIIFFVFILVMYFFKPIFVYFIHCNILFYNQFLISCNIQLLLILILLLFRLLVIFCTISSVCLNFSY